MTRLIGVFVDIDVIAMREIGLDNTILNPYLVGLNGLCGDLKTAYNGDVPKDDELAEFAEDVKDYLRSTIQDLDDSPEARRWIKVLDHCLYASAYLSPNEEGITLFVNVSMPEREHRVRIMQGVVSFPEQPGYTPTH